jgi:hypothetical protein
MDQKIKLTKISKNELLNRIKQFEEAQSAREDDFRNLLKGVGVKFQEMSEVYEEEQNNL